MPSPLWVKDDLVSHEILCTAISTLQKAVTSAYPVPSITPSPLCHTHGEKWSMLKSSHFPPGDVKPPQTMASHQCQTKQIKKKVFVAASPASLHNHRTHYRNRPISPNSNRLDKETLQVPVQLQCASHGRGSLHLFQATGHKKKIIAARTDLFKNRDMQGVSANAGKKIPDKTTNRSKKKIDSVCLRAVESL